MIQYFGFDETIGLARKFGFGGTSNLPTDPIEPTASIPNDYVLRYDFNGDVLDKSPNLLHGIINGTLYYEDGRKEGTFSLSTRGGNVDTSGLLPVNSDKVSISLWLRTLTRGTAYVLGMGLQSESCFNISFNNYLSSGFTIFNSESGNQNACSATVPIDGVWRHFIFEIDRSRDGVTETLVYVDTISQNIRERNGNTSGNFTNGVLTVGNRTEKDYAFGGMLQDLRVYNRNLTELERAQLFNE